MGQISASNQQWLVKSLDQNNNGIMEELQVDASTQAKVDSNRDGQISRQELGTALQADAVEIRQGRITESRGGQIFVNGLETLKNVHTTAQNSWNRVWAPSLFPDDTLDERYTKLVDSNRAYSSAVSSQESALRSIRDMTANATDATSRALHIQAKTALNSASWHSWIGVVHQLSGFASEGNLNQMHSANTHLQAAYETLNNTLRSIAEQTDNLPDIQGAIQGTDQSIRNAFANIQAIQSQSQSPQQVHDKLQGMADAQAAQSTGRAPVWGAIGAGIGAVGGAAIGYFAGGKNIKSAAMGAGVGLAVAGGGGALVGHMKDKAFEGQASSLRALAGDVMKYNPSVAQGQLISSTQALYGQSVKARETHDLDNARVNTNRVHGIHAQTAPIEQESARILEAYRK